jgi:hypothetical protein
LLLGKIVFVVVRSRIVDRLGNATFDVGIDFLEIVEWRFRIASDQCPEVLIAGIVDASLERWQEVATEPAHLINISPGEIVNSFQVRQPHGLPAIGAPVGKSAGVVHISVRQLLVVSATIGGVTATPTRRPSPSTSTLSSAAIA